MPMMMGGIATQRNADPGGSDVQEQASEFGAPKGVAPCSLLCTKIAYSWAGLWMACVASSRGQHFELRLNSRGLGAKEQD